MSTRKKYGVCAALIVFLLATATVTPAFMEKPDPQGGGLWPAPVCLVFCSDGYTCSYTQWTLYKDRTFVDHTGSWGAWNLSGGVFTFMYPAITYTGTLTGRNISGTFAFSGGAGSFAGVHSPPGCVNLPPPVPGAPLPDGSQ